MKILEQIQCSKKTSLAFLLDPAMYLDENAIKLVLSQADKHHVDFILVGGSLVSRPLDDFIDFVKMHTQKPVILFPGSLLQLSAKADAMLLLSLISGRNADLLIGNHVIAAPYIKEMEIEVLPTGYILIGNGKTTSVEYISQTMPIPAGKEDLILATAMAGEQLGLKLIYLECGSGADAAVNALLIEKAKNCIQCPIIVGGGIRTKDTFQSIYNSSPALIVIGNGLESNPYLLDDWIS